MLSGLGPLAGTLGTLPSTLRLPPAPDSEAALSSGVPGEQMHSSELGDVELSALDQLVAAYDLG